MITFTRDDGRELRAIAGFRNRVLSYRPSKTPQSNWTDDNYAGAVNKRLKRGRHLIERLSGMYGALENAEVLEIGCGDGLNTILFGLQGVKRAVGIDLDLRLDRPEKQAESVRRLVDGVVKAMDVNKSLDQCLSSLPVELLTMDATRMRFPDRSFDLLLSRSALEHIHPVDKLFAEIERLIRPRGIIYHEIDPFFWLRGCHKRGLVDIPWAHARLTPQEYHRYVVESEGNRKADKRLRRLNTLNRMTLQEWKAPMESGPFEIIEWSEITSPFAEAVLKEYPEVTSTLLPGVEPRDLVVGRVRVCLRNRAQ